MGFLIKLVWMKLMWRLLTRLLRFLGWGAFLVPVAALSMAVFGVGLWTVALVVLAGAVAFRRPPVAAALVPAAMVCLGIAGLVVAAATPGLSSSWSRAYFGAVAARPMSVELRLSGIPRKWVVDLKAGPQRKPPRRKAVVAREVISGSIPGPAAGAVRGYTVTSAALVPPVYFAGPGNFVAAGRAALVQVLAPGRAALVQVPAAGQQTLVPVPAPPGRVVQWYSAKAAPGPPMGRVFAGPPPPSGLGLWRSRLLVPVALLLLTLGLWLLPRTLARLRARLATQDSDLRTWMRENRWGLLLVPVTVVGLTVFGVRPWTVAAVVAALIVVVKWPKVAADLVPLALAAFAVRGFMIAANWQSLAAAGPGPAGGPAVMFGAVLVDGRSAAMLAGAEASALLAFGAWLVPRTIGAHARTLLAREPDPDLVGRVQRLTETRGHAVDAATSELRRIERDLHDGAQARLVALGMNLRAVERLLPASPEAALGLVAEARETSLRALNELRDLIRGIYPPVLADRGLGHAVQALALDTPVPTELDIDLPGRLSAPVESACYFAVAEALANAVKHSGARHVHIRMQHKAGILRIEVADDGAGGADPARGTGLQGVERRLGTFDGILAVNSPPGGPTMIAMEVPCALLPKTWPC
ncbi:MAG TPA: histidine kinase [Streptosporangiaceae bacterium]|nr:histidine kinase [Streptosporangiaceae bacterium]